MDGLRTVIEVEETALTRYEFQVSMAKCFSAVGLDRGMDSSKFIMYKENRAGTYN